MNKECYLLKNGLHIDTGGLLKACCLSSETIPVDFLETQNRKPLLTKDWIQRNCKQCIELENKKTDSMREHINNQFNPCDKVYYLDIRFSNLCNMACVMCDHQSSSIWQKLQNKKRAKTNLHREILDKIFSSQQERSHTFLHFAGGEPLLIKEHYDIFRQILACDQVRKIDLQITTNLSLLPNEALKMFERAGNVRVCVSLDATGEDYDYIRFPGRFKSVSTNLHRLLKYPNIEIVIQPTLSILNVFSFDKLINYFIKLRSEHSSANLLLYPHPLIYPEELNLYNFDFELSSLIKTKIKQIYKHTAKEPLLEPTRKLLKSILDNKGPGNTTTPQLKQFLNRIDLSRKVHHCQWDTSLNKVLHNYE